MHSSKKTSNHRVTGLCGWTSPVTGEFPAQSTSNTENVPIWWRHHEKQKNIFVTFDFKFHRILFCTEFQFPLYTRFVTFLMEWRHLWFISDTFKIRLFWSKLSLQTMSLPYFFVCSTLRVLIPRRYLPKWHDDVIKWKHFPCYWPFVRGIHRYPVNSPHKGQWRGALMFSLICVWINGWENNRETGDLRRHRVHYDVTVMNR